MREGCMRLVATLVVLAIGGFGCAHHRATVAASRVVEAPSSLPAARVHFATGSDAVLAAERKGLEANARWIAAHPDTLVVLEGHSDERGSDRLNLELGDRRARSIKAALIAGGANDVKRIAVISAGERQPIDSRHAAAAWKKNRRVEFIVQDKEEP